MALSDFGPDGHAPAPMDLPLKLWLGRLAHGISPASVTLAYADWLSHLLASPSKQADLAASALRKSLLWRQHVQQSWHGECPLCVEPLPQDKRFSPPEWHAPPFGALAQAFLLQQQWWTEAMTGVRGVSRHHEDVAAFTTRQWLDMWSPSNFVATNPQVQKETLATGAANLVSGLANWSRDALAVLTDGRPRGVEQFMPGQNVAATRGKVVFRNRLIELIQYEPTTAKVDTEPVLIVPSWIMKYYILDLTPDNSLVKYLVTQGHTVFMVSWKNPDGPDRDLGMDDYLELGVMAALAAVQSIQPRTRIHAMGYCLGGTLLAIAAAAMGGSGRNPLKTVTLLAAQTDFQEPGELGLFIDESQIAFVEDLMADRGYLDGRQMAGAFQLISSKDLVWSKLVHEYLMGAHTPMTALRAWNADATRLPARMHSEYLRRLYLHNDLAEGRYRVAGRLARLADIKLPLFVVATERDHVSPWQSVYKIHRLAASPISFVLSSGGHNVAIVNPPTGPAAHPQASYRFASYAPGKAPADPQSWLDAAAPCAGSWWPCWHDWLRTHSGGRVKPPRMTARMFDGAPLAAPGSYVHLG
ncbi:MAG: alpha/beta fold hydrolase [Polaromonas sp.]|nr:alpha/beta fold hydrolase [Polaromonas sp.]